MSTAAPSVTETYQHALRALDNGLLDRAEDLLQQVIAARPNLPEAWFQMSRLRQAQGRPEDGLHDLDRALAIKPDEPALWTQALTLNSLLGQTDQALGAHDRLIALAPGQIKPQADKAWFLQQVGDFDSAERLFRRLIKRNPGQAELYRMFVAGIKLRPADPLIRQMQKLLKEPRLPDLGRVHLGFALAKVMEDQGRFDRVFPYLDLANGVQARLYPFDRAARMAEVAAMMAAQADGLNRAQPAAARPGAIFVTGMPRSGTTLVERILSGHRDVAAGGEMGHALRLGYGLLGQGTQMTSLADIPDAGLTRFAELYRQAARASAPGSTRWITDKAIQSWMAYGLIRCALPDARLVVVHRDPRDIALSIYKNFFTPGTHRYANDLADIAWQIHSFHQALAVWKDRLPDSIIEVSYEALVQEPITQARALIDAVGLDWDDGCLAAPAQGQVVKTLSLHQVRQPIHAGRTAAWTRFETELRPFTTAWEALTT